MKIKLPVTWELCGFVEVEAESIEEAVEYFKEHTYAIETPDDPEYVDGSFWLSDEDVDFIALYQEKETT